VYRRAVTGADLLAVVHGLLASRGTSSQFWAITVGSNMAKATPLVGAGGPFADFLQMAASVGGIPGDDARFS